MPRRTSPTLPVHNHAGVTPPDHLRVDGLVQRPLELTAADLAGLAQEERNDDFACLEGWTVPGVRWHGVPLAALLDLAGVREEARWVQASAGEFSVPLPLAAAHGALLALRLNGEPLPPEHGGPVRLLVPGAECFTSVKWLDRLELRVEPAENTARATALGRLPEQRAAGS